MSASCFKQVFSVTADGNVPVTKYKSDKTGLTVIVAEVQGPLVNGYFCLATEAHDDDGLPHTLEHLVFMGSEDYPYKGVLDLLANRCLASGTNAWTDTDHTCYTMTNAGSEGFLNLLPIYLDHILYPTLTESGFITEVHHINGEGEDAGVVYCEMQGRENSGESRTHLELVRAMYPGHCGYKSETGGIMKNLRDSTSHTKVCNYHREFYRPENLCLIITGQIKVENIFKALQPFEKKISSKGSLPAFTRPWQSVVPPLETSVNKLVKYPADDEEHGMVSVAWRGPLAKEQYTLESFNVLYDYLSDSAISPLQRDFVEMEDPYCSKVHCSTIENSECCIYINFQNVPKEKLQKIDNRLSDVLKKLGSGEEKIDMKRMNNIIHRKILEALSNIEDRPHDTLAFLLVGHFLFDDTKEDLETRASSVTAYRKMKEEPDSYWAGLIAKYCIGTLKVVIVGEPSKELQETMAKEEADRVCKQREDLGPEGLRTIEDALEKAMEENEKEAPDTVLTSVAVPDVDKIYFHPISPSSNHSSDAANKNTKFPLAEIPFKFQLDDINTHFVQTNALLDTSCVPQELKYYLPLFCELLFESPVMIDGVLVSHEEIISRLEADTLTTSASLGCDGRPFSCGRIPQILHVFIKVEEEKYAKGVQWLKALLYNVKFPAERMKIVAKRMSNDIAELKRKGPTVVRTILRDIVFTEGCNHHIASMLRQQTFLNKLLGELESQPEKVEKQMEKVRQLLTYPDNLRVHMSASVNHIATDEQVPQSIWRDFTSDNSPQSKQQLECGDGVSSVMKKTHEFVNSLADSLQMKLIVGVGSVESSFYSQVVPCINSWTHEDLAPVMVFIQYLTQLEGPLWRQIRGQGLAYHYSMYVLPDTGLLYFVLQKSTHVLSAFKEGKNIVMGYVEGKTEFTEVELESAKSSLTFEVIESETTVSQASNESMLSYFRDIDHNYNKELLTKISKVTLADLKRVGPKYITPLFDPAQIRCALCCNPSKVQEVVEGFKELSMEFTVVPSLDEGFLCTC